MPGFALLAPKHRRDHVPPVCMLACTLLAESDEEVRVIGGVPVNCNCLARHSRDS